MPSSSRRVASSFARSVRSRRRSFVILRSIMRVSLTISSFSIFSRSIATVMIGRGPRRPLLEATLFVPLLLLLLMSVILPLFVVSVKPVVYDCGLIVDKSDRSHFTNEDPVCGQVSQSVRFNEFDAAHEVCGDFVRRDLAH